MAFIGFLYNHQPPLLHITFEKVCFLLVYIAPLLVVSYFFSIPHDFYSFFKEYEIHQGAFESLVPRFGITSLGHQSHQA